MLSADLLHPFTHAYLPSAAILTAFVTTIAYLRSPRLKVMVFSMPIPFTCAYLATALPIDATHVAGLVLVVLYHWVVYGCRIGWRLPLGVSIAAGLALYLGGAVLIQPLSGVSFWPAAGMALGLWALALLGYRHVDEPGHRSNAPWWLKLPTIFVIALAIFSLKGMLAGAVTTFPYAGVFTSYEMRHSLRSLAAQFTVTVVALLAMLATLHLTEGLLPGYWPLVAGWASVFLSLVLVYRLHLKAGPKPLVPEAEAA